MSRTRMSLRTRLVFSHLAVVSIGVAVLLVAGNRLSSVFIDNQLRSMGPMMSGAGSSVAEIEAAVRSEFNRALIWAAVISGVVAIGAASLAAARVLRPLGEVRRVAQRLATGSYEERVPIPAEWELAELAGDVNALAEALEQTEQRRLQLVSEVAHELRTPVATLKGYLEGILDGVFSADEDTLTASMREITRIERLASDLSTLSRTEEGQMELHMSSFDLSELATEVTERLRPQFEDNDVGLRVAPGPSAPVTADRDRLAQVLTNLVGNALAYTPAGGQVEVRSMVHDGLASVEVADNGRGLSTDQLPLVFERFYRADRSATGGSGIGLTIARGLARLLGGDVTATSAGLGDGATFTLTIPLASPDEQR
jgi:signal transduction histidine kinase